MPGYVHNDRGPSLISKETTSFLHNYGVVTSRTTSYNPEGNGQVERYNGIIWQSILLALKSKKSARIILGNSITGCITLQSLIVMHCN